MESARNTFQKNNGITEILRIEKGILAFISFNRLWTLNYLL